MCRLESGVTHVGTEGTGVSWQPVHAALEDAFTVIVGNASHMRNLPGSKTDVKDVEWIADLVRHGLVRASFVPPTEVGVLRELVRHRKALAGTLAAERNRTLKLLESAGIKLAGVMSSVFGVSGMLMLRALAEGTATPAATADLAKRRLRRKRDRLALALDGALAEHQRFLLGMHIRRLEGSRRCLIGANFRGSHGIAPCRTGSFGVGAVAPGCGGRGWRLRRATLRRSTRHARR